MQKIVCGCRYAWLGRWLPAKTLRVMKLTMILLTAAFCTAHAAGVAQSISLSGNNIPFRKVFTEIKKQTGYVVFYNKQDLEGTKPVSLFVQNMPLPEFLNMVFHEQPLGYVIEDKTIILSRKLPAMGLPNGQLSKEELPPPVNIMGQILDVNGVPVAGATITVKGSNMATAAATDGRFSLAGVPANATILISAVGYVTLQLRVQNESVVIVNSGDRKSALVNGALDNIMVVLARNTQPMDEVQIIAYGTTTKRFNVGAVTTVTSEEIKRQPVTNAFLALQGRVPGLIVTPGSGAPGATVKLQVRGQNTLAAGTNVFLPYDQPLILIDGVPFAPQNQNVNVASSFGGGSPNGISYTGFSGLNNINPSDIESITVLRDADATSIYGSQGANGVILITTKKGTPGKTRFSATINTGPNKITRRQKFLNTQQYLELRREGLANDGIVLPPVYNGEHPDLLAFDTTKYTDWFDRFYGGTSNNLTTHASLTGGSENTSFILSAGYNRNTYNFPGDFAENMFTLHGGFHYTSKNNKFSLDFGTDYSYGNNNNASNPEAGAINELPPNLPDLVNPDGSLLWMYKGINFGGFYTAGDYVTYQHYAYLKQKYILNKYNLNNSLQLSYKVLTGLTAMVNLGYSRFNSSERSQFPLASFSPFDPFKTATAQFAKNEFETVNIEPQLNYQRNIGNGVFTLLVGGTYKQNINQNENITGSEYTNDGFLGSLSGAGRIIEAFSNNIIYKYVGAFGRLKYVYNNKYILHIAGRRDGSSNFGPGRQFGNFGSAGAGWILSEEAGIKKLLPFFSLLKLSVNYGTNGSDGVEPYNYQAYWNNPPYTNLFQGMRPYFPMNLYNPDYSWALKKSWNLQFDLGLFNDNLLFNVNLYRNRTGNQLVGNLLPLQTGFSSVTDNLIATVQNKGIEIAVSSTNARSRNFTWSSNFNFSVNRNKLVEFIDLELSPYSYIYSIGQSTSVATGFHYKGVNDTTGVFEFYDSKGNPTYAPNYSHKKDGGDREVIADLQPGFTGGLGNTITFKGFSLYVFFQFAKQTAYNYLFSMYAGKAPGLPYNMPVQALERWQQPGDKAVVQRATADYSSAAIMATNYFLQSTGIYSDASYMRLKTLSLAYTLPAAFAKKMGMESLQVYMNAQNLLTITGYEVGDPEMPGQLYSIPLQKNLAFGLSVNF